MKKTIGILGGTFDPIHLGHLRVALELYEHYDFQQIRFVPCQQSVLDKTAQATPAQRLAMLQLAIADQAGFVIDERELNRSTPSYMIDTLLSLRAELDDVQLCLILGSDILKNFTQWYRWQELIQLARIMIILRPGNLFDKNKLPNEIADHIVVADDLTPLAISSTVIRKQITSGFSPRYLLPEAVWDYIQREKLYL